MFDVIVIGAGPAGISAAIYAKRANLNVLVLYSGISNLEKATKIDNYYGFPNGITGKALFENGVIQAKNLGIDVKNEEVVSISLEISELEKETDEQVNIFNVKTTNSDYTSKTIIIATGNKKIAPNIKGIKEFEGKGISYCAICDAFFYRNKEIAVIGSGNFALSEVEILRRVAKKIYVLTNGDAIQNWNNSNVNNSNVNNNENIENFKNVNNTNNLENVKNMNKIEKEKIIVNNIEINNIENVKIVNKKIKEITGNNKVNEIIFEDGSSIPVNGVFIALGEAGANDFAKTLGIMTEKNGNIIVDENMMTNVKGIFACGNITGGLLQVNKSAYEGAKAGLSVSKFLKL